MNKIQISHFRTQEELFDRPGVSTFWHAIELFQMVFKYDFTFTENSINVYLTCVFYDRKPKIVGCKPSNLTFHIFCTTNCRGEVMFITVYLITPNYKHSSLAKDKNLWFHFENKWFQAELMACSSKLAGIWSCPSFLITNLIDVLLNHAYCVETLPFHSKLVVIRRAIQILVQFLDVYRLFNSICSLFTLRKNSVYIIKKSQNFQAHSFRRCDEACKINTKSKKRLPFPWTR